jgi:cytochrome c553
MKKIFFALLLCSVFQSHADEISDGRTKAEMACSLCHGPNGVSTLPNAPHLAGQQAIYLREQLRNYRSGKRNHEVMSVIAKSLTDQEIDNLAAWFASIKFQVN